MKNRKKNLDDLVFERRNKTYGAYANRKNYNRYMFWALIFGVFSFMTVISAPLIASYVNSINGKEKRVVLIEDTLLTVVDKKTELIIPEPPKPKPMYRPFVAPIVVDEEILEDTFASLLDSVQNRRVDDTTDTGPIIIKETGPEIVKVDVPKTFLIVEEMPEFPGGDEGRIKYLANNTRYPESARDIGISGPVYVTFVVNESGRVVEVELLRGIGGGCDEEALKVIRNMPRWSPGRQGGMEVRVRFSMTIHFKLGNS